jgi:ABC-type multidrug transport system fused ATPase/permease subunit
MYQLKSIFLNLEKSEKIKSIKVILLVSFLIILDFVSIGLFLPLISSIFSDEYLNKIVQYSHFDLSVLDKKSLIIVFLVLVSLMYIIKNSVYLFFNYSKKKLLADIQVEFSSRVFKKYISQNYQAHLEKDNAELLRNISLINEYTSVIENFISLFIEFVILLFILILIFYTDSKIGYIISALFFLIFIFHSLFSFKRLNWYGKSINIFETRILKNILNTFGNVKEVIICKKQDFFNNLYRTNLEQNLNTNVKVTFLIDLPRVVIEVTLISFLCVMIYMIYDQSIDKNDFIIKLAFLGTLIFRAIPSISKILYQGSGISSKYNKLKIVNNLIKSFDSKIIYEKNHYLTKPILNFESLEFKNVSFAYAKNRDILKNVNLVIKKNETIGIFSDSGSGKSTFLDLASGLLKPTRGDIIINNKIKFDAETVLSFQDLISYISQNNFLLNDTIRNNIAFGLEDSEINSTKVNNAIKVAKLTELVNSKPENLNFLVHSDGKNISAGQKQRIIIARSIYRDSPILFLDEATNALDTKTEHEIIEDVKKYFYNKKTILICSHKKELLNFCHKIYSIKNKEMIELNL